MMTMRTAALTFLLLAVACGGDTPPAPPPANAIPATFLLAADVPDAGSVRDARAARKTGDDVVVVGKVKEFVPGLAAFQLADLKLKSCKDMEAEKGEDHCDTPWDYCCEDVAALKSGVALVELRANGQPIQGTVRGFHGIDHLSTVVVRGKAEKDEAGNLTIVASGLRPR